jgi:hypothetical protein
MPMAKPKRTAAEIKRDKIKKVLAYNAQLRTRKLSNALQARLNPGKKIEEITEEEIPIYKKGETPQKGAQKPDPQKPDSQKPHNQHPPGGPNPHDPKGAGKPPVTSRESEDEGSGTGKSEESSSSSSSQPSARQPIKKTFTPFAEIYGPPPPINPNKQPHRQPPRPPRPAEEWNVPAPEDFRFLAAPDYILEQLTPEERRIYAHHREFNDNDEPIHGPLPQHIQTRIEEVVANHNRAEEARVHAEQQEYDRQMALANAPPPPPPPKIEIEPPVRGETDAQQTMRAMHNFVRNPHVTLETIRTDLRFEVPYLAFKDQQQRQIYEE